MYNEKSKKNLRMFSSKNQPRKNGRHKGSLSLINSIKKVLESVDPKSKKTILELLANAAAQEAIRGNSAYFKEIIERLDGKVVNKFQHAVMNGSKIKFEVSYED